MYKIKGSRRRLMTHVGQLPLLIRGGKSEHRRTGCRVTPGVLCLWDTESATEKIPSRFVRDKGEKAR